MKCAYWFNDVCAHSFQSSSRNKTHFSIVIRLTTVLGQGPTCNMVAERIGSGFDSTIHRYGRCPAAARRAPHEGGDCSAARQDSETERRSGPPIVACSGDVSGCPSDCWSHRHDILCDACGCCSTDDVTSRTAGQPCFLKAGQDPVGAFSLIRLGDGAVGLHLAREHWHAQRHVTDWRKDCRDIQRCRDHPWLSGEEQVPALQAHEAGGRSRSWHHL